MSDSPDVPVSSRATNLRNALVIAVTTVVIVGAVLLIQKPWQQADTGVTSVSVSVAPGQVAPAVGAVAPDFTATTIDGATVTLSDLRGEPVWLLFGATWCTNCRSEVADVQALSQTYAGRVHIVAVYVQEDTATVTGYAQRSGLTYPQIADVHDTVAAAYAVNGIPAHLFLDADGVIKKISVGTLAKADAAAALESLLKP